MSLRPNVLIEITQVPNDVDATRSKVFTLDFIAQGEINSSWQNLTDTAKLRFPRNVYVEEEGKSFNWGGEINQKGQSIYGSVGNESVLFMRGDKIKISLGYFYDNMDGTDETLIMEDVFSGYIAKIKNRMPIELECEDEMWKLKFIKCPNKIFRGSEYNVQQMIEELLQGTGIKVTTPPDNVTTNIGDFRTQNETVAQVLERLRKDGGIYSYFRNGELRCSGIVYYPEDRNNEVFCFQDQEQPGQGIIINDTLEYTRKEDLNIAVKVHAESLGTGQGTNFDGSPKTSRKRLELLYGKNGEIPVDLAKSFQGELITLPVLGATTHDQLLKRAKEYLPKFYYTGFRGSFNTFGQPMVKHGDSAQLIDNVIPERTGTYLLKQVTTRFGMNGFRQACLVHLRIDKGFTVEQLNAGL